MAGGQNGRPLLYNGYHYMGGYSSYRGDYSGKDMMSPTAVEYIADQFQGMGFGPGHMYPLVPMTMDHAHMSGYSIPHSAPAQYSMAMTPAYTSGHIPSSPPSSGGPSSGAMVCVPVCVHACLRACVCGGCILLFLFAIISTSNVTADVCPT